MKTWFLVTVCASLIGCLAEFNHRVNLPTKKPLNIAHRGASGVLPEHTLEGYRLAIEQGADVIECDVCVTRDLQLVCRHESQLEALTDVTSKPELVDKQTTYQIGNKNITDTFTVDLTLEEIKTLRVKQKYSFRDQNYNLMYQIPTLQEYIDVAKNADRPIGIYPEVKDPEWVNSLDIIKNANTSLEELMLEVLHNNGYQQKTDPCFIQSFSVGSIQKMSSMTVLPLVMLIGSSTTVTDEQLEQLSTICYGIGPSKSLIFPVNNKYTGTATDLVARAHKYNLKVHPYTFRNEYSFLAWNYTQDPYAEYEAFANLGIDGYFTDFPGSLHNYLSKITVDEPCSNKGNSSSATEFLVWICVIFLTLLHIF